MCVRMRTHTVCKDQILLWYGKSSTYRLKFFWTSIKGIFYLLLVILLFHFLSFHTLTPLKIQWFFSGKISLTILTIHLSTKHF